MKMYRSPFFRDFLHLNVAMMTSNNALVPDPDKEDILASVPTEWPFLHTGLRMCGWGDNQVKYYLIGHPLIWWGGTLSLLLAIFTFVVYVLRMQRHYVDFKAGEWDHFMYVCKIALVGWALEYGKPQRVFRFTLRLSDTSPHSAFPNYGSCHLPPPLPTDVVVRRAHARPHDRPLYLHRAATQ